MCVVSLLLVFCRYNLFGLLCVCVCVFYFVVGALLFLNWLVFVCVLLLCVSMVAGCVYVVWCGVCVFGF